MGKKQASAVRSALRRFRKSAVFCTKTFFTESKLWCLTPFRSVRPQPSMQSAQDCLPHFAGDPTLTSDLNLNRLLISCQIPSVSRPEPSTWEPFKAVLRQPPSKAPGQDRFRPHLLHWLPEDLGNAMHAVRTQCARSAKFWMSANTRTLALAPFDKFLVPYKGFLASQAFRTWHI